MISVVSRSKLGLIGFLFVLSIAHQGADAFPSLFGRTSLFKRTNQQQQQQQPAASSSLAPASKPQQKEQLMPLANSFVPMQFGGHSAGSQHELMRLTGQPSAAAAGQQISAHQLLSRQPAAFHHLMDSAAAAYYKPNVVQVSHQQEQQYDEQPQAMLVDSLDSMQQHQNYPSSAATAPQQHKYLNNNYQYHSGQGLRNEPTHTSEVVDKIEAHIGQQIEHSLNEQPNMAGYHQHQHQQSGAAAAASRAGASSEKEAAASGASEAEASEHEEGGSGESEEAAPKAEKREHKEAEEEKKEEHPPEAFEVHHKKGGKSFQYFHQGHSS